MTSRQVAERVGRTITTVNRWVSEGRLTPALVLEGYNGPRLFDPASVDALTQQEKAS